MASRCSRFMNRTCLSSLRSNLKPSSPSFQPNSSFKPTSSPLPRFSFSRTPSELGCAMSLLPLHSAVSSARMTSCLSTSSIRALSQELGQSVPR